MIPRTPIYALLATLVCIGLAIQNTRGTRLFGPLGSPRASHSVFGPQHK